MDSFIASGKALGLEGKALTDFVEAKEAARIEREERKEREKLEREEKKAAEKIAREEKKETERLDREAKSEAQRLEREERAKEREIKLAEIQALEKEKEREYELAKHEIEMKVQILEKQIELEKVHKLSVSGIGDKSQEVKAKIPKLPPFNEAHDSLDAYLMRFERFAENAGWDESNWATNLSALIQGKALDVYSRLSPHDAQNYNKLKKALLKRFQLTEEGFRLKFRCSKPEVGETPPQFVVRLEDYLLKWMNLASVSSDFNGLKDLFLREQFMQSSSQNLQVFLKEIKVKSVYDMAEIAEQYNEAHSNFYGDNSEMAHVQSDPSKDVCQGNMDGKPKGGRAIRERYCYFCQSPSHMVRECPKMKSAASGKKTVGASGLSDGCGGRCS